MLSRTLPATLLQIYFEVFLNSKVIVNSIGDPDNNFKSNSISINGVNPFIPGDLEKCVLS